MLIDHQKISNTPIAGTFSGNTAHVRGLVKQIVVKPLTETTTYNVSIINPLGAKIYERLSETGTLSELTDMPCNGIYTVTISSATVNELFVIQIITQE